MITAYHKIVCLIERQAQFLTSLLYGFPYLQNQWIIKQEKEIDKIASENSKGDKDVYQTIRNNEMSRIANCEDEKHLFYQAIFIMVYSYYESILFKIAKNNHIEDSRPSKIAHHFNQNISDNNKKNIEYIYKIIKPLRHELCHNNNGTLFINRSQEEIKNIRGLEKEGHIQIEDGCIYITDIKFIENTLKIEEHILTELSVICGYKKP